jgi:ABC-type tungstate transport system substrate-binding protein
MNAETFLGYSGVVGFLFFLGFVILGVAAILMPIIVIFIHGRTSKIAKTLASMEDMMRNGK